MNELKTKILDLCNNSDLPLEAIIFVVKDIWRDAEDTYELMQKRKENQKKENEKEEDK